MRQKEWRLIITFHTTAEAMAMEKACRADGLPGRLIPVPRQITAGCGLSWSTEPERSEEMTAYLDGKGLRYEAAGNYLI